jgi:hypothetical protein
MIIIDETHIGIGIAFKVLVVIIFLMVRGSTDPSS